MAKEKDNSLQAERTREIERVKNFINGVAATPDGIELFKWLMDRCGFQKNNICVNPQTLEINVESSNYNEARRSVYLEVRRFLSKKACVKVELGDKK